jgi:hypothetical protein
MDAAARDRAEPSGAPVYPAAEYRAFAELLGRVEQWAARSAPAAVGYPRAGVAARLVQRVGEVGFGPFVTERSRRRAAGQAPASGAAVACGGLRVGPSDGSARPEWRALVRALGGFALRWLEAAMACVAGALRGPRPGERGTLLLAVGMPATNLGGDDRRFAAFCRRGPVAPLRDATRLVVQTTGHPVATEPAWIRYTTGDPLLVLARAQRWRPAEILRFLGEHARALVAYVVAVARCPAMCLLAQDFAHQAVAAALNRRGAIEAVVMPHSVLDQALWMTSLPGRRFTTHMVWYSTNSTPFVYAADPGAVDHPSFRHIRVDASWVWTESGAAYLRGLGIPGRMHVVGPILWYLPDETPARRAGGSVHIALFDVTPVKRELEGRLGIVYHNYYRTQTVVRFVEDVLAAARAVEEALGKPVRISLKPKRDPSTTIHDAEYLAFVRTLEGSGSGVAVLPPATNLFSLMAASDVAVVIPYSSPAYVASWLGKPAVYYDPTEELVPNYEDSPLVTFAAGRENLTKALAAAIERAA